MRKQSMSSNEPSLFNETPINETPISEPRSPGSRKRRFVLVSLVFFVIAGTASLIVFAVSWLPGQYRQQAARTIVPDIRAAEIGSVVFLGFYEQDNDKSNGTEPIEWIVLDKQDERCLLMSRYALDCIRFNSHETFVTWDQSSVLTWLNDTFYYSAFKGPERMMLLKSTQKTDTNPYFDTDAGEFTEEKIFLANIADVAKYLSAEESRQCKPTAYAIERGASVDSKTGNCIWWLRSPGFDTTTATRVLADGRINYCGYRVHSDHQTVRPWMWITLNPNNSITEG